MRDEKKPLQIEVSPHALSRPTMACFSLTQKSDLARQVSFQRKQKQTKSPGLF
jgi:hypothetical protein